MPKTSHQLAETIAGGTEVIVPDGRDSRFPTFFSVDAHALDPSPDLRKTIWVFIQDTREKNMAAFGEFEDGLQIPLGPDAKMATLGLVELHPPLAIYARAKGCDDELKDILVAFVVDAASICDAGDVQAIDNVMTRVRGDPSMMTVEKPVSVRGKLVGGTYFERLGQKGLEKSRCYTLSQSYQFPTQILGPTSEGKVYAPEDDKTKIRRDLIKAGAVIVTKAFKMFAPIELQTLLETNADLTCLPRIGCHENVAFPAVQLNMAPAVEMSAAEDSPLQDMGSYADAHKDVDDSGATLTGVLSTSNAPERYEQGRLHILHLGAYVRTVNGRVSGFSGLHPHGGSPPLAPADEPVDPSVLRAPLVFYPNKRTINPDLAHVTPFASLPNGQLLKIGPEVTHFMYRTDERPTNHSNWVQDGGVLMQPADHFDHVARLSFALIDNLWRQLPSEYQARLDFGKFMEACTMGSGNDQITLASRISSASNCATTHPSPPLSPDDSLLPADNPSLSSTSDMFSGEWMTAQRLHSLSFLDYTERCSRFIPQLLSYDFSKARQKVCAGHTVSRVKGKGKRPQGTPSSAPSKRNKKTQSDDERDSISEEEAAAPASVILQSEEAPEVTPAASKDRAKRNSRREKEKTQSEDKRDSDSEEQPAASVSVIMESREAPKVTPANPLHSIRSIVSDTVTTAPESVAVSDIELSRSICGDDDVSDQGMDLDDPAVYHHYRSTSMPNLGSDPLQDENNVHDPSASDTPLAENIMADNHSVCSVDEIEVERLMLSDPLDTTSAPSHPTADHAPPQDPTPVNNVASFLAQFTVDEVSISVREFARYAPDTDAIMLIDTSETHSAAMTSAKNALEPDGHAFSVIGAHQSGETMKILLREESLSPIRSRLRRALIMATEITVHQWLNDTISAGIAAVQQPDQDHAADWIGKLARHLWRAISAPRTNMKTLTLASADYITGIPAATYKLKLPRYYTSRERSESSLRSSLRLVLCSWVQFSTQTHVSVRGRIFDILKVCPYFGAILYLDVTWRMYQHPYDVVIHARQRQNRSVQVTDHALKELRESVQTHDLAKGDSSLCSSLSGLFDAVQSMSHS